MLSPNWRAFGRVIHGGSSPWQVGVRFGVLAILRVCWEGTRLKLWGLLLEVLRVAAFTAIVGLIALRVLKVANAIKEICLDMVIGVPKLSYWLGGGEMYLSSAMSFIIGELTHGENRKNSGVQRPNIYNIRPQILKKSGKVSWKYPIALG
jgi:hypothetical protein